MDIRWMIWFILTASMNHPNLPQTVSTCENVFLNGWGTLYATNWLDEIAVPTDLSQIPGSTLGLTAREWCDTEITITTSADSIAAAPGEAWCCQIILPLIFLLAALLTMRFAGIGNYEVPRHVAALIYGALADLYGVPTKEGPGCPPPDD